MNYSYICSNQAHEKDPLDNFCITCHIETISLRECDSQWYFFQELLESNDHDGALACYDLGIELNLSLFDTCNKIGDALRRINKEVEANNQYKRGFEIKKKNLKILQEKSEILEKQMRLEEALICQEQILEINNNYSHLYGQQE